MRGRKIGLLLLLHVFCREETDPQMCPSHTYGLLHRLKAVKQQDTFSETKWYLSIFCAALRFVK